MIITVVTDDKAMKSIFNGTGSLLARANGRLFINCATISPSTHVKVEGWAAKRGAQTLEACMASSITQARDGTLYLMCGGKREAFDRALPILDALSVTNKYIGETGSAAKLKALVNMVMALPFALRILVPRMRHVLHHNARLALALDMNGRTFWRRVLLPRCRAQIGFAAGLTAALSLGDLGVIALFADPEVATLPLQVYRLMGAYRMEAAQGAALLLFVISMGAFWILDRGGRLHAEA